MRKALRSAAEAPNVRQMDDEVKLTQVALFVGGWVLGVLTPLATEFLKRQLFGRAKLVLTAVLMDADAQYGRTDDVFFHVHAVNVSDLPIILTVVSFTVWHGKEAVGTLEQGMSGLLREHDFPLRLSRHEDYTQSVSVGEWLQMFIDSRLDFYQDDSDLDFSRLAFEVHMSDTTNREWHSKRIKLGILAGLAQTRLALLRA